MNALFTYGSLMCADIMQIVAGDCRCLGTATLAGYRRLRIKHASYPGLIPAVGEATQGVLYSDISAMGWARLDDFEGDFYQRCLVEVVLDGEQMQPAFVYVVKSEAVSLLEDKAWDFEAFLQHDKAEFMAKYGLSVS